MAASNGSCRSVSFVRFLRSRLETIFVFSVSQASATITGCVQDASYACKKRTPHSRHFRFDSPPFPVALQAAKSRPALGDGVSGRDAQDMPERGFPQSSRWTRVRQILVVVRLLSRVKLHHHSKHSTNSRPNRLSGERHRAQPTNPLPRMSAAESHSAI